MGPGKLPAAKKEKNIFGVIAPHAGYIHAGGCEAYSDEDIAESKLPEVFIMLGLSHSGYGSCVSLEDWDTPLGIVKNDKDFGKAIMKNTDLKQDEETHSQEHSIEVQLPFLQFINKNELKKQITKKSE